MNKKLVEQIEKDIEEEEIARAGLVIGLLAVAVIGVLIILI